MDALTLVGLAAVTAMLVFYALENRSPWHSLAFAGACALGSVCGCRALGHLALLSRLGAGGGQLMAHEEA
jgi:hypothetical protein